MFALDHLIGGYHRHFEDAKSMDQLFKDSFTQVLFLWSKMSLGVASLSLLDFTD